MHIVFLNATVACGRQSSIMQRAHQGCLEPEATNQSLLLPYCHTGFREQQTGVISLAIEQDTNSKGRSDDCNKYIPERAGIEPATRRSRVQRP